jgi:hypothetical protein
VTTLKAESVSLYLEGLMILTYNKGGKWLEAAPLSYEGHRLKGVIHQRQLKKGGKPEEWQKVTDDLFECLNLQEFATGRIFIEPVGAGSKAALSDSCRSVYDEEWGTFGCIPNLEKEFFKQEVKLKHDQLKPTMRISTGTFYSVPIPHHPSEPIPNHSNDENYLPPVVESFLVNRDKLRYLRETTPPYTSEDQITQGLVNARKSWGIRVYTAATLLKLGASQSLVCQLEKKGVSEPVEVLRIEHDPNHELRMAIKNFSNQTVADADDPIHTFHSLYFYEVIENKFSDAEHFLLSDEYRQRKYVKREKVEIDPRTGAGNPGCPIGWIIEE